MDLDADPRLLMSSNTIELEFADGKYLFALPLAQINELQRKCGIGIGGLYARVLKGFAVVGDNVILAPGQAEFYALDIVETVRHGLIGGGTGLVNGEEVTVTPFVANRLVDAYVLTRPYNDSWSLAGTILGVCILGYDPPKKDQPAKERATKKAASTTA